MKLFKYFVLVVLLFSITACAKKEEVKKVEDTVVEVKVQSVGDSKEIKQEMRFSAVVIPSEEAQIVAKTNGTVQGANFKIGDRVNIGDRLLKVDDINKSSHGGMGFNANTVKQAQLAVEQAYANLSLARTNYQNILLSSDKDLKQVEIAKNQAGSGKKNTGIIVSENIKSAQLAYETARMATEQASINLENQKTLLNQQNNDIIVNAKINSDTIANTCDTIINGINNITDLDASKSVDLSYKSLLGVLDVQSLINAESSYVKVSQLNIEYKNKTFNSDEARIDFIINLTQKTKKLADDVKVLFDKTITSVSLPFSGVTGVSLSSLRSQVASYQSQCNTVVGQAISIKQSLHNVGLSKNSTLDNLTKVYELAQKQESSAKQNLNNLLASTDNQKDQASFGSDSAANQYENTKIKINSQLSVSKSQIDMADIQYKNALVALENLYDSHLAISPISGVITKKLVGNGSVVSAGQSLVVVAKTEKLKIQFFIDQENLTYLKQGYVVAVYKSDGQIIPGKIWSFATQADAQTRRFQVEVRLDKDDVDLIAGTIVDVVLPITKKAKDQKNIILPLSAIEIGQNQSFIMIVDKGRAKKVVVSFVKVEGEAVEVFVDLPVDAKIIVEGNKFLEDGDLIKIK